jgi:hypothetical protein
MAHVADALATAHIRPEIRSGRAATRPLCGTDAAGHAVVESNDATYDFSTTGA